MAGVGSVVPVTIEITNPGSIEIDISNGGWGGDFSLDSTNDLVLALDRFNTSNATQERLIRLILTNPRISNTLTGLTLPADDRANPTYGAGARRSVGAAITEQLIAFLQAQIIDALLTDPGVVQSPAPQVTITQVGAFQLNVSVVCTSVSGQIITIPSLALPPQPALPA